MRRFVVIVWYNGLGKGNGDVEGHYRTQEEAEARVAEIQEQQPEAVGAVYELL